MAGGRVDRIEYARRVNAAAELVGTGTPALVAARAMAGRYGVSVRQARRYVEQAVAAGRIEIPEANVVFTVKLPGSLAGRVREHARQHQVTLSAVVAGALAEFLRRDATGRRSGA